MGFKDDMDNLSIQIKKRAEHVTNEETTKQALIIPFLQVLGYDVFDPLEVRSEYQADFGKRKAEKVDYSILNDGKPIIFIEAKPVNEKLGTHSAQLARYFNSTQDVKLAILTNGMSYKFYTDLNANNMMDDEPFLKVDIGELSDADITCLRKFRKEAFDTEELMFFAEEMIYTTNLKVKLKEIFDNPPDEFIRYLIKDFRDTRITSNVIERFRPIVKKSISKAVIDIVSQGLFQEKEEIGKEESAKEEHVPENGFEGNDSTPEPDKPKRQVVTTEEELQCFELVKEILQGAGKDISELNYKDTIGYFGIFNKNILKWFLRLYLDGGVKSIIARIPFDEAETLVNGFEVKQASKGHGDSSRIVIKSPDDLKNIDQLIIKCFDNVLQSA